MKLPENKFSCTEISLGHVVNPYQVEINRSFKGPCQKALAPVNPLKMNNLRTKLQPLLTRSMKGIKSEIEMLVSEPSQSSHPGRKASTKSETSPAPEQKTEASSVPEVRPPPDTRPIVPGECFGHRACTPEKRVWHEQPHVSTMPSAMLARTAEVQLARKKAAAVETAIVNSTLRSLPNLGKGTPTSSTSLPLAGKGTSSTSLPPILSNVGKGTSSSSLKMGKDSQAEQQQRASVSVQSPRREHLCRLMIQACGGGDEGIVKAFKTLDLNGNGKISMQELLSGLQTLKVDVKKCGYQSVNHLMREMDFDKSSSVELSELFVGTSTDLLKAASQPAFRDTLTFWRKYDRQTDTFLASLGKSERPQWDHGLTEEDIAAEKAFDREKQGLRSHTLPGIMFKLKARHKDDAVHAAQMRHLGQTKDRIERRCKNVQNELRRMQNTRRDIHRLQRKMLHLDDAKREKEREELKLQQKNEMAAGLMADSPGPRLMSRVNKFEETIEVSEEEKFLREVSKTYGIHVSEVERLKKMFDKFDEDKSGEIARDEFNKMYRALENIPESMELPDRVIERSWQKVDVDQSGNISFEEFLYLVCDLGLIQG